jgi:transcriptional regulator of arginine metabolism
MMYKNTGGAMKKDERHEIIRQLLRSHKVSHQDQLLNLLKKMGIEITQATLSRDLHALRVGKVADAMYGHIYTLPDHYSGTEDSVFTDDFPVDSIRSLRFSANLGVLKTQPSFAPTVGLFLDKLNLPEVTGTVAGDDTVLIILEESVTREEFVTSLLDRIPRLQDRLMGRISINMKQKY